MYPPTGRGASTSLVSVRAPPRVYIMTGVPHTTRVELAMCLWRNADPCREGLRRGNCR